MTMKGVICLYVYMGSFINEHTNQIEVYVEKLFDQWNTIWKWKVYEDGAQI